MSFDFLERSLWGGKPVAFFKFTRGTSTWRYTSADRELTFDGDGLMYTPAAIKRSSVKLGAERRKLPITVTVPRDLDVVDNWFPMMPRDRITLTIFVKHHGDADYTVDWIGRVIAPKRNGKTVELTCEPTLTTARRAGLSRCWQRACGLALYSQGHAQCNVDKAEHALPATLTQVDSINFTSSALLLVPSGRLAGGFIEYTRASDGVTEYRTITAHADSAIEVEFPLYDAPTPLEVTAYPGCRQTFSDCNDYFDNAPNYGGDLWLPGRNPHDGNPVW